MSDIVLRSESYAGLSPAAYRERVVRQLFALGYGQVIPLDGKIPTIAGWPNHHPALETALQYAQTGNIGLVCGDIVVLDIDVHNGGVVPENLPPTWAVRTGSGGYHYYFRPPPGVRIGSSVSRLAPGVDVRGHGGQAVLPGSIHPDTGEMYTWLPNCSPDDL